LLIEQPAQRAYRDPRVRERVGLDTRLRRYSTSMHGAQPHAARSSVMLIE
jgi:hypothetical protein